MVDLKKGESFTFLGFEYRRILSLPLLPTVGRLTCTRHDPKLLHHAQGIHQDPAIGHLAGDQTIDHHALNGDLPSSGGHTQKRAALSSSPRKPSTHFVAFRDHLVDDPMHVGERSSHFPNHLFQALSSRGLPGQRIEFNKILDDEFVQMLQLPFVQDLFDKLPDQFLVVSSRHGVSVGEINISEALLSLLSSGHCFLPSRRELLPASRLRASNEPTQSKFAIREIAVRSKELDAHLPNPSAPPPR